MKIFCVIPAFNEEDAIVRVLKSVKPLLDEVIVVDDGSADKTAALARGQGAVVLSHILNRGQGAALQTGNEYAVSRGADIIVHFDADGQFLPEEINELILPIRAGQADVVFGSRFLGKKSNMPWFKRYVMMNLARLMNRVFFKVNLSDPQCGFRAMSARAAQGIRITNDGMAHCSEIMSKAVNGGFKYQEEPATVLYRDFGQGPAGGLKIVRDLIISKLLG